MNAPRLPDPRLADYCLAHGIRRLSLFGSQAKGTARPESDIDLLVEFDPGREPGLIGMAAIEAELSRLLGGRKVDLRTPGELSHHFREQVLREAQVQYAA
jgi:predicted nucleotidyltransferase